ncbi:hypothetical protein [Marmoricola sp. RAF53]|uniref:hypothetical protein n=1 Tax=Marmoricola sp. RAF53 TaxID=3233059 RepID=UPI003F9BE3C9
MKSPSRRRAALAALLLAPTLAACGFNVQTDQVYQPAEGVNNRAGQVDILNATVVSGTDGSGTFAGTLVNNSQKDADQLTEVSGEGLDVTLPEPIDIPAGGLVNLADEGTVSVEGESVVPGGYVMMTFVFANGQSTTVQVPVVVHGGDYADVPLPQGKKPAATE